MTNGEWPPYLSEELPHYGFASHIVEEAFAAVDINVEYGFFPWQRSYNYAREGKDPDGGKWHGTLVWVPTEERRKHFTYTDSVISDQEVLFHLKSRPLHWKAVDDLQGKTIGGTLHTVYPMFEKAAERGLLRLEKSGDYELLFKRLLLERIDAVPHVLGVADYFLNTSLSPAERQCITFSPTVIQVRNYHVILSRNISKNARLADLFNQGLEIIKKNGRYQQILHDFHNGKYHSVDK